MMTFQELRDRIVEDGIKSVHANEKRPEKIRGCLAGFELISKMNTPAEITSALASRRMAEDTMFRDKIDPESWWEYRCCTAQLEYAFEIIKVGLGAQVLSGNAVMRYAAIVGTKEN
jgi:hypothetical protein